MKAGKFYIGDLCYVMHNEWEEACNLMFDPMNGAHGEGIFKLKDGREFAIFGTAHGDGSYLDQNGREYAVDSGSIGCILADSLTEEIRYDLANVVEIKNDFTPYSNNGTLYFGDVKIETDWFEGNKQDYDNEEDE
jgi:hypothetical protein